MLNEIEPMNQEYKNLWVKALRSKKYEQGIGHLHNSESGKDKFCCLGVLCEVGGIKKEENHVYIIDSSYGEVKGIEYIYDGNATCLSEALKQKFGLSENAVNLLISANDGDLNNDEIKEMKFRRNKDGGYNQSFHVIANWIEKHL